MTVAEIQSVVASYLQRTVDKFDVAGTDVNLLLVAMNNARKYAEKRHNWSFSRKKGYFSVTTSNKVALDSPTWFDGGTEKMKEGKHWWLRGSSNVSSETMDVDRVLKVIDQGVKYRLESGQEYEGWGENWEEERLMRVSGTAHPLLMQNHGITRGKWLELYPVPTETKIVVVDGFYWWSDWTNPTTSGEIRRKWSFTEGDITLSGGPARVLLDLQKDNAFADREAVSWVSSGVASMSLVETNPGYATCFTSSNTLSDIVEALDQFVTDGRVWLDGSTIYVEKEGVDPMLSVKTFDGAGVLIDDFNPSVYSDTAITNDTTSDWWTENAEEFLILRSIVEANRLGQMFVGNKEGNLPPPVKEAEAALELLIKQDEDMMQAGGAIEIY